MTVCCFICKRYRDESKMDERRCLDRVGCYRTAARLRGRKVTKKLARMFVDGTA